MELRTRLFFRASRSVTSAPCSSLSGAISDACSVWRWVLSVTRHGEDVAQEAFIRILRHAAVYDVRRGSVATWTLTITRNLAIDALRVRRPIPRLRRTAHSST